MKPRTTGILFLLTAALGAFVWFYEIEGEEGREEAKAAEKRLFPAVEQEAIEWIELVTTDGQEARLERKGGSWQLVQPLAFPSEGFAVDGIAAALSEVRSEAVFDDPQPPATYGLDADEMEVRFGAGGASHALRTGKNTPMGANSYASIGGDSAVYTVPTQRTQVLRKSLDDLRDKKIADFDPDAIERVEARWPGGSVIAEKTDDGWQLSHPVAGPGDAETIEGVLQDLSFLRAEGFVDEPGSDAAASLEPPAYSLELVGAASGGGEPSTLLVEIGDNFDGKSRLVRSALPSLYRIGVERLADFPQTVDEFRYRTLAEFAPSDAAALEMVFHSSVGQTVGITAARGDGGWTSEPDRFAAGKLSRLVSEVADLKAARIGAESAGPEELAGLELDPPALTLTIYGPAPEGAADGVRGEPLAEISFGIVRADGIYAQVAGKDVVYVLDGALAEHVPVSLEAFRNRFVAGDEEAAEVPADGAMDPSFDLDFDPTQLDPDESP